MIGRQDGAIAQERDEFSASKVFGLLADTHTRVLVVVCSLDWPDATIDVDYGRLRWAISRWAQDQSAYPSAEPKMAARICWSVAPVLRALTKFARPPESADLARKVV